MIDSWSCRVDSVCIGCAQGLQLLGPGVLEWLVLYITASPRSESHLACADVNPARVLLYSANSRNHGVVLTCGRSEPTSRCRWRCMVSIHAYGLLSLGYLFFFARRLCRWSSVHRCVWQECTGGVSYAWDAGCIGHREGHRSAGVAGTVLALTVPVKSDAGSSREGIDQGPRVFSSGGGLKGGLFTTTACFTS